MSGGVDVWKDFIILVSITSNVTCMYLTCEFSSV